MIQTALGPLTDVMGSSFQQQYYKRTVSSTRDVLNELHDPVHDATNG